jgi:hypothetical protein
MFWPGTILLKDQFKTIVTSMFLALFIPNQGHLAVLSYRGPLPCRSCKKPSPQLHDFNWNIIRCAGGCFAVTLYIYSSLA